MNRVSRKDLEQAAAERPPMSKGQVRTIGEGSSILIEDETDLLIEAPTGFGKTAVIARLANEIVAAGGKPYIMTHRRELFRQLTGKQDGDTLKERLGEIAYWSGIPAGSIAEERLGGVDLEHDIVVGMVETASNIGNLSGCTHLLFDEVHHASEESSDREILGAYAQLIESNPDCVVAGFTATSFRGDEDRLHPRIEQAERIVIAIEDTEIEGRTVPARTTLTRARLANGMTPTQLFEDRDRQIGEASSISKVMKDLKNDQYYRDCFDDWESVCGGGKTIAFTDDVAEIKRVTDIANSMFGEGSAVMMHGGMTDKEVQRARREYEKGNAKFLVACKMIGEGFDVPRTDNVMCFNSSLSRGDMNQYVGRGVRASEGKDVGNFLDCGLATAMHGPIEEQHRIQTVRARVLSQGSRKAADTICSASVEKDDTDWSMFPGEKSSIFFTQSRCGRYFQAFELKHDVMKGAGRRVRAGKDAGQGLKELTDSNGLRAITLPQFGVIVGAHLQKEGGFISRIGGLEGEEYRKLGTSQISRWQSGLDLLREPDIRNPKEKSRNVAVRRAVRGERGGKLLFSKLGEILESNAAAGKGHQEMLSLCGAAFDEAGVNNRTSQEAKATLMDGVFELAMAIRDGDASVGKGKKIVDNVLKQIGPKDMSKSARTVLGDFQGLLSVAENSLGRGENSKSAKKGADPMISA